jgi:hypothetical protein
MNPTALKLALIGVLVMLLVTACGVWKVQDWRYEKQISDLAQAQAQIVARAERWAREEEQRRYIALEKVKNSAQEQIKAAVFDVGSADAAGDRLYVTAGEFVKRSASCTVDTRVAGRSASATRAAMVLSDLLQRVDKRAGELAAAYDRARIAGLACERAYESISLP